MKALEIFYLSKSLSPSDWKLLQKDKNRLYHRFIFQMRKMDVFCKDSLMSLVEDSKQYENTLSYCLLKIIKVLPGESGLAKIKAVAKAYALQTAQKLLMKEFRKELPLADLYSLTVFRDQFNRVHGLSVQGLSSEEVVEQIQIKHELGQLNQLCQGLLKKEESQKKMVQARLKTFIDGISKGLALHPEVELKVLRSRYLLALMGFSMDLAEGHQGQIVNHIEAHLVLFLKSEQIQELFKLLHLKTHNKKYLEASRLIWEIRKLRGLGPGEERILKREFVSAGFSLAEATGNLGMGEACIRELLQNQELFVNSFGRMLYFGAWHAYASGDRDTSLSLIHKLNLKTSTRKKKGISWQSIVLEMICWFEKGDEEMAIYHSDKLARKEWDSMYPKLWVKAIHQLLKGKNASDLHLVFGNISQVEPLAVAWFNWELWLESKEKKQCMLSLIRNRQSSQLQLFQSKQSLHHL